MPLLPGACLGSYEIIALLGAGGMGEVYRAHDPALKRDVALKVLPSFVSKDSHRLRRFEQEARAAAALNHPNILAVFQMGSYEGFPYLVSELLEGLPLREHLARGKLPVRRVIAYGAQIARGLAAAHEKGITHRDLKPENLFVTKDGQIKILDFGLAKLTERRLTHDPTAATMSEGTEPGVVLGTVGYMSPEQVRGESADHRSDIFACGAILYEMLSGKRAFHKTTSAETMTAILNEDPPALSRLALSVPPSLQRVVHHCLEKNPEQRFQSASDLAFALDALSDSSSAEGGVVAARRSRITRKAIAAVGLAVAAITGLALLWALPSAMPQVTAVTQLTDDAEPKQGRVVSDGSRVYFNEGETGSWTIAQVSVNGGQTAPVATRLANPQIAALTPDGSALLAKVGGFFGPLYPLWLIPLPAGEPRRVGDFEAEDASFFPDGRIAFTQGNSLFVAEKNGSSVRRVAESNRYMVLPDVSPDGNAIDVTLCCQPASSLLELNTRDYRSHPILHTQPEGACCSSWTPDGKYLVFQREHNGNMDLWAVPPKEFLRRRQLPVALTHGPLLYTNAVASRDGKHIFAIGSKPRGELVRYDENTREYVPYLGGISVTDATFSHDGKWVAYRSYPDASLWRSRSDGSDRLQLTYPPTWIQLPFISPDGTQVSFGSRDGDVFVVSREGGTPHKVAEQCWVGTWSPDGKLLALTCSVPGGNSLDTRALEIRIADLQSGKISTVPESQGNNGAQWIDQNTLVAGNADTTKFLTLDLRTQKWAELASGVFVNWIVSPDRKSLLCTTGGPDASVLRIRFSDHNVETVSRLAKLRRVVGYFSATQISVAPDGSPVFTRDTGTQEIYSLTVKWP